MALFYDIISFYDGPVLPSTGPVSRFAFTIFKLPTGRPAILWCTQLVYHAPPPLPPQSKLGLGRKRHFWIQPFWLRRLSESWEPVPELVLNPFSLSHTQCLQHPHIHRSLARGDYGNRWNGSIALEPGPASLWSGSSKRAVVEGISFGDPFYCSVVCLPARNVEML